MRLSKSITSFAAVLSLMLGGIAPAYAVPAKQGLIPYEMPDGSIVDIRLHGDEHHSFATTADGYVVKADSDNVLRYMVPRDGRLVMSDMRVTNIDSRSAEVNAMLGSYDKQQALEILEKERVASPAMKAVNGPQRAGTNETISMTFPTKGKQRILVILAEYSDVKFTTPNAHQAFDNLMNQPSYTTGGATGSAFDFFTASSNGQFEPEFDVYGPVTLPQKRAYYGAHTASGEHDSRTAQMIYDACELLDDEVDFSLYDANNDGYVDNVYVFFAGNGEADSGIEEAIWPHAWYVYSGGGLFLRLDGKIIDHYACSGEFSRTYSGNVLTGIGTFCHEFSHVMGLPDLYSTGYTSGTFTPGEWSLMDQGSYNNNQRTPPTHSAYERFVLGWIVPEVLEDASNITLKSINDDYNSAYRITTGRDGEYYLLENRQQNGWDRYIPGHGMLIWHIDYSASVWRRNQVNDDPAHQRVDIEEADNTRTESSRAGDAFPGTSKATAFTDDTEPSMITWRNVRLEKPITDIREKDGKIFFQFKGGVIDDAPGFNLLAPSNLTAETATLSWGAVNGVNEYFVDIETADGTPVVSREKVSGTSYNVSGLTFETRYIYTVYYSSGDFYAGKTSEFTTPFGTVDYHAVKMLPATAVTTTSFVANWEALQGAESYSVTVYESDPIPSESLVLDFTDKTIAAGWSSNAKSFVSIDGYYGANAPSLALSTDKQYIESPVTAQAIESVSFGARGRQNGQSTLDVCVLNANDEWVVVENIQPDKDTWTTYTVDASKLGDNVHRIKLVHNKGTLSNIVVDDVTVTTKAAYNYLPMTGKTDVSAGASTSMTVDGLKQGTLYFYSVKAHQGDRVSRDSEKIAVTTAGTSAIVDVDADSSATVCRMVGETLEVTTAQAAKVEVYTVSGILLVNEFKEAGTSLYQLGADGIYVVKVGNKAYKLTK